jgi:hypothetical protein
MHLKLGLRNWILSGEIRFLHVHHGTKLVAFRAVDEFVGKPAPAP